MLERRCHLLSRSILSQSSPKLNFLYSRYENNSLKFASSRYLSSSILYSVLLGVRMPTLLSSNCAVLNSVMGRVDKLAIFHNWNRPPPSLRAYINHSSSYNLINKRSMSMAALQLSRNEQLYSPQRHDSSYYQAKVGSTSNSPARLMAGIGTGIAFYSLFPDFENVQCESCVIYTKCIPPESIARDIAKIYESEVISILPLKSHAADETWMQLMRSRNNHPLTVPLSKHFPKKNSDRPMVALWAFDTKVGLPIVPSNNGFENIIVSHVDRKIIRSMSLYHNRQMSDVSASTVDIGDVENSEDYSMCSSLSSLDSVLSSQLSSLSLSDFDVDDKVESQNLSLLFTNMKAGTLHNYFKLVSTCSSSNVVYSPHGYPVVQGEINSLCIEGAQLNAADIDTLVRGLTIPKIYKGHYNPDDIGVPKVAISHFVGGGALRQLVVLTLVNAGIGKLPHALDVLISGIISYGSLTALRLDYNSLNDRHVRSICKLIIATISDKLPLSLQRLSLSVNGISSDGAFLIMQVIDRIMMSKSSLCYLDLSYNTIGEKEKVVIRAKSCSSLQINI